MLAPRSVHTLLFFFAILACDRTDSEVAGSPAAIQGGAAEGSQAAPEDTRQGIAPRPGEGHGADGREGVESTGVGDAPRSGVETTQAADSAEHGGGPSPDLLRVLHDADLIGEVRVTKVTGRDGTMGRAGLDVIYSDVEFEAIEMIRDGGNLATDGSFALTFLGGELEGRSLEASDGPRLSPGDHFIMIAKSDARPYPTYDGSAGILPIIDGRVHTNHGYLLLGIGPRGYRVAVPQDRVHVPPFPTPEGTARGRPLLPVTAARDEAMTPRAALDALRAVLESRP